MGIDVNHGKGGVAAYQDQKIYKTGRLQGKIKPFISRCQVDFQVNIGSNQLTKQTWNFWETSKLEYKLVIH